MSALTTFFAFYWIELTTSFSVQLFAISAVLLFLGLMVLVWLDAHRLMFLDPVPLSDIEISHPHLPSFRTIVVIFLCCVVLLVVALQTMSGLPPFDAPFQWLYLAAFFVLSGTVGVLAELLWKGTRDIAFAFITGTVIAFLFLVFKYALPLGQTLRTVALLALLILAGGLAWRDLFRSWSKSVQAVTIIVFILWLLVYMFLIP